MGMEKRIMHMLEFLHPVLLLALICPFFCVFYRERPDEKILPVYLAGYVLLICSAVSRLAMRRVRTFRAYVAVCIASLTVTCAIAWILGGRLFGNVLRIAYLLEIFAGSLWMLADACRIRIHENRRKKAEEEQDISWVEQSVFTQKPVIVWLIWFLICYFTALFTYCSVFCDISLISGAVYLIIVLIYRQLDSGETYLTNSENIANVPKQKIRRLRTGMLLASLVLACAALLPSLLTMKNRTYHDLRFYDFSIKLTDLPEPEQMGQAFGFSQEMPDWMELLEVEEVKEPPKWLEYSAILFSFICIGACALLIARSIVNYFLEFRSVPEENGDIAEALNEDSTEKITAARRLFRFTPLSERERIRRAYRRTIRKYRKELPLTSESPSEIEGKTLFPSDFDVQNLHDTYEKARYGKNPE